MQLDDVYHCKNLRDVLTFMVISVAHSVNILTEIGMFLYYGHIIEVYMVVEYFLLAEN